MKKFTKLLGIVLIIALVMSMGITAAFAVEETTETIQLSVNANMANSQDGGQPDQNNTPEDYVAFKIFGATKNPDNLNVGDTSNSSIENQSAATASEGISYFLKNTSPWAGIATNTTVIPYLTFTAASDGTGWTVGWNLYDETNNPNGKEYTEANAKLLAKALSDLITEVKDSSDNVTGYTVGGTALTENTDYYKVGTTAKTVPVGYYLITSSLGSNLVLATTDIKITEKNEYPKVDKSITRTSDDATYTENKQTEAQVGDTVNFKLTATIPDEANQDVELHDVQSLGLSLKLDRTPAPFTVKLGDTEVSQTGTYNGETKANWYVQYSNVTDDNKTIVTTGTTNVTYVTATTVGANGSKLQAGDSFVVVFTEDYIKSLDRTGNPAPTQFVFTVEYDAVLNDNAILATATTDPNYNPNKVKLDYSNYTTPWIEVKVYTHEFDLIKYFQEKSGDTTVKTLLKGAEFKLYRDTQIGENGKLINDATPLNFVKGENNTYRVWDGVTEVEAAKKTDTLTSTDGKYNLEGLDVGDYYLEETKAPDGFNKLANMIKITVSNLVENKKITGTNVAASTKAEESNGTITYMMGSAVTGAATTAINATTHRPAYQANGVAVENNSGTVLPSTGGIGTTIFYVVGSILVIAAGVLLITKKRMSREG